MSGAEWSDADIVELARFADEAWPGNERSLWPDIVRHALAGEDYDALLKIIRAAAALLRRERERVAMEMRVMRLRAESAEALAGIRS